MKKRVPVESAAALIDAKIEELGDWRGKTLAKVRAIVNVKTTPCAPRRGSVADALASSVARLSQRPRFVALEAVRQLRPPVSLVRQLGHE